MSSRVSYYIDLCKIDNFMKEKDFASIKEMCSEDKSYVPVSAYFVEWYLRYKPSHKVKVFEKYFIENGYFDRASLDDINNAIFGNGLSTMTKLLDFLYLKNKM